MFIVVIGLTGIDTTVKIGCQDGKSYLMWPRGFSEPWAVSLTYAIVALRPRTAKHGLHELKALLALVNLHGLAIISRFPDLSKSLELL